MYEALAVLGLLSAQGVDLSLPLAASSRPEICAPERSGELWDRARLRPLERFCQHLARAQASLATQPEQAVAEGQRLATAWPGRPEPWALIARAHARLGAHDEAWSAWTEASTRGYDFRPALALRDYAVSASFTGRAEPALKAYLELTALAAAWPDPLERQALYLEAALAGLRASGSAVDISSSLTRARSSTTSVGLRALTAGVSSLVAELQGRPRSPVEELDSGEIWHFVAQLEGKPPAFWPRVPEHELAGAASLLIEPFSEDEAAALWERYRAGLEATGASADLKRRAERRKRHLGSRAESPRTPPSRGDEP